MNLEPTTLVFELVNFLVLLWVLQRLVYRPLHQAIHARREELAEERAGLQAQREALEKEQTELDEGLAPWQLRSAAGLDRDLPVKARRSTRVAARGRDVAR